MTSQIAALVQSFHSRFAPLLGVERFAGLGLGAPGAVDREKGILSYPPNLPGWKRYPLRERLLEILDSRYALRCSLEIDNDANAAAYGEAMFGAGKGYSDFMLVTLGTGVGGGIILARNLYRGPNGTAGEIGYLTIDYRGESVHAGIRGTVESLIGKQGIVSMGKETYRRHPRSCWNEEIHGEELRDLSPRTLEKAAHGGDAVAREVWDRVGSILGVGLAGVVSLMDIRTFIIGGGISAADDLVLVPAFRQLKQSTLPSTHEGLAVVQATLGNEAGVYGAAALCFSSLP
ncbi:ROK family protein [Prosthecochloris sp. GSB1]|uniref:ROK family protein n=1 Tax=Prosthecochloris sp. GSB1 TaxID=281093 RepID=UPI0026B3B226